MDGAQNQSSISEVFSSLLGWFLLSLVLFSAFLVSASLLGFSVSVVEMGKREFAEQQVQGMFTGDSQELSEELPLFGETGKEHVNKLLEAIEETLDKQSQSWEQGLESKKQSLQDKTGFDQSRKNIQRDLNVKKRNNS